jgi:putative ATPase
MKEMGYGDGYRYAHDFDEGYVDQQTLPTGLEGREFYRPTTRGYEKTIGERIAFWKRLTGKKNVPNK